MSGVPQHVAIIMDGNGRWAQTRGFGRPWGHREGAKRVDEIVTECSRLGVRYLTLYAFSTENWNRPPYEVNLLMKLLTQHLGVMDKKLLRNRIQLTAQGSLERLPRYVQNELKRVRRLTAFPSPRTTLNLCLSYGGRQELVDATKAIATKVAAGEYNIDDVTEGLVQKHLYQPELPDPDLLIRTGGESRVSNFLLWQIAYAEFVVTPALWPEFSVEQLHAAFAIFAQRRRRFGKTQEQIDNEGVA